MDKTYFIWMKQEDGKWKILKKTSLNHFLGHLRILRKENPGKIIIARQKGIPPSVLIGFLHV